MRRRLAMITLALAAACQAGESPMQPEDLAPLRVVAGVEYSAETRVMESFPVQLATDVTITNRSAAAVRLTFPDACVVTLRAYAGTEQVWDQRTLILCAASVVQVDLEPGASRTFQAWTDAAQILGSAGLPDGRYRLEAVLRPSGETVRLDAGTVDLGVYRTTEGG